MRYGVIADVHGNRPALEAALGFLADQRVDAYLCAGDLVGYGPAPDECVARVLALPRAAVVAGNHDLAAIGALDPGRWSPLARETMAWTRARLRPETRAMLAGLPLELAVEGILLTHGAIGDPERYVESPSEAAAELRSADRAEVVTLGHTHRALAVDGTGRVLLADATGRIVLPEGGRVLVNPGSVGQSRERRARARVLVLDLGRREAVFHALPYDVAAARTELRAAGLPVAACHQPPPGLPGRALRKARRLARGLRPAARRHEHPRHERAGGRGRPGP